MTQEIVVKTGTREGDIDSVSGSDGILVFDLGIVGENFWDFKVEDGADVCEIGLRR